jgi:hypothetical protein
MGNLHQDPSPIPRIGFTAAGSSMVEVEQNSQCLLHNFVGRLPLHLNDEPNATGIVLELGIVETLLVGKVGAFHWELAIGEIKTGFWRSQLRTIKIKKWRILTIRDFGSFPEILL